MTVDFVSPSQRASGSDLTISISPLGLVELADEEFEVHGPRLNRYAHNWAWYLGHHWAVRREAGEPQLTFNWVKAFSDFLVNWSFGRGLTFRSPRATSAIVPSLLNRVWTVDNDRGGVLWAMGNMGSVSGDCFVKVAYQEPAMLPVGADGRPVPGVRQRFEPGRVRIMPLNSSFCFPEFAPHDRERLIRFKQKYRFWGTTAEGTRSVFTYTELITDLAIEEYVNDQLIAPPRPNPLGVIPIVHIPNREVSGSPWGLSDTDQILTLNRTYNELATEILDILNYYVSPVTVITGGKLQSMERGARKMWAFPNPQARVQNLEGGVAGVAAAHEMLKLLVSNMHSLVGVPEGALGAMQPISNTSGVALAINYLPTTGVHNHKKMTYGRGIKKINEYVLRTLAQKEPLTGEWSPEIDEELKTGQLPMLDWDDPITYRSEVVWPPPLPTDVIAKLAEIQQKMALGLESKRGALAELGEEFPDTKLSEIMNELEDDAIDQGALDMIRATVAAIVSASTGMIPGAPGEPPQPQEVPPAGGPGVNSAPDASGAYPINSALPPPGMDEGQYRRIQQAVNMKAFGTNPGRMREPSSAD